MRSTEEATEGFDVVESPPSYQVVRPHYFGLSPRGLVVAIAAAAFVLAVFALATGNIAVGVLLLVAACFLGALYLEQARRQRESSLDRIAAAAVDNTRALAGFTGTSVRVWTRAGRDVAKLRIEANMRARERSHLQYALGGACFDGDESQIENLRDQMRICTERIEECVAEAKQVVERTKARTSSERRAFARTQVRPPS